jgi:integrase
VARAELTTWTPAELRTFLESVSDDRLAAAWRTLASIDARRGEVLALRWRDLDLDAKRLRIERSLVSLVVSEEGVDLPHRLVPGAGQQVRITVRGDRDPGVAHVLAHLFDVKAGRDQ